MAQAREIPSPQCPTCGYSLRKLNSDACPECGADLRRTGVIAPRPPELSWMTVAGITAEALLIGFLSAPCVWWWVPDSLLGALTDEMPLPAAAITALAWWLGRWRWKRRQARAVRIESWSKWRESVLEAQAEALAQAAEGRTPGAGGMRKRRSDAG